MMKGLAFLLLLVTNYLSITAQDLRDSLKGIYEARKDYYIDGNLTQSVQMHLYVLKDETDSTYFTIIDSSQGNLAVWNRTMEFFPADSTIKDIVYPIPYHGNFYGSDSVFVYRWGMSSSNNWAEYYGKRKTSSVNIRGNNVENIEVFPTITTGKVNIIGLLKPAKIKVYDLTGQLIISYNSAITDSIDLTWLQSGAYFLVIELERALIKKIIKIN